MMKQKYETKCFIYGRSNVNTFREYREWLEEIQTKQNIEIVSLTSLETVLIVTYKEGGNQ